MKPDGPPTFMAPAGLLCGAELRFRVSIERDRPRSHAPRNGFTQAIRGVIEGHAHFCVLWQAFYLRGGSDGLGAAVTVAAS
jgi:hypothetical protein